MVKLAGEAMGKKNRRTEDSMESTQSLPFEAPCLFWVLQRAGNEAGLALSYSYLKLGRRQEVERFTGLLAKRIRADLGKGIEREPDRWLVAHIGGFGIPNAAALLARRVAEALGLSILALETGLSAHPDVARSYASLARTQRRALTCHPDSGPTAAPSFVKGRRIILVEDAVVTGTVLQHAIARLSAAGVLSVSPYVLVQVDSQGDSDYEDRLNRTALRKQGLAVLSEILNAENGIFTTRLVYLAFELGSPDFERLAATLTLYARLKLYLYALEYFGFQIPSTIDALADSLHKDTGIRFPYCRQLRTAASKDLFRTVLDILEEHGFDPPPKYAQMIALRLDKAVETLTFKKPHRVPSKRPRLKKTVKVGTTGIEIREGGRSTIDITVDPSPTKLMAMRHFLRETGYLPETGLYIGNQTSSRDERDGILTAIQGLSVLAVDEDQAAVIPEAVCIGPGMAATRKKLEELTELSDQRLPVFIGLDVDDTILGRKIVVDRIGTTCMTKEDLLEDRMGIAAAIVALSLRGVRVVFLSDNSADSTRRRIAAPLEQLFAFEKTVEPGMIDFYASGMVTHFRMAGPPGKRVPVHDSEYGIEHRLSAKVARVLQNLIGTVEESSEGKILASGLLGAYYTTRLANKESSGKWRPKRSIERTYPGVELGLTAHGNLEFPVTQQRDLFKDGSVAQISILPIVSSETVPEDEDERARLVMGIADALSGLDQTNLR